MLHRSVKAVLGAALAVALAPAVAHAAGMDVGGAPGQGSFAAASSPPPAARTSAAAPRAVRAPRTSRTLRSGMRGADVADLQRLLRRAGCSVAATGSFAGRTGHCVRWWQTYAGLKADGVVPPPEMSLLRRQVADAASGTRSTPAHASQPAPAAPAPIAPAAPSGPPGTATITAGGLAVAPGGAPTAVQQMIAAGNQIATTPYLWGGGHGSWTSPGGYDCSGSVSYVLHAAGLLDAPLVSGDLANWGDAGPGQWVTIYANADHVWMVIAGVRFDTRSLRISPYSRWTPTSASPDGYAVRHPPGL